MPRKGPAVHREIAPDPVYQNPLVTQLINKVLLDGKKTLSERTVYKALEMISERTANDPVITLKKAVENVRPLLEVRSRRVGGATYQVPVEVRPNRGTTLALRWLVNYSRARREHTMACRSPRSPAVPRSWTPRRARAPRSSGARTCTRWPRRTRHSRTTDGDRDRTSDRPPAGAGLV